MAGTAGALVGQLLIKVLHTNDDISGKLKSTLGKLYITLKLVEPHVDEITELRGKLDQSLLETNNIIEVMESGVKLILELSKLRFKWWNCFYKRAYYQEKLEELNASIMAYFQIDTQAQIARTVLDIEAKVEVRREYPRRALINKSVELRGMCTPPPPPEFTVGLDVPLNELKLKLLKDEVSVSVHTVVGSTRVGKTTLVKALCWDEDVRDMFEKNIFFFIFGTMPPKLNSIVQQLFQYKSYPVPKLESDEDAVQKLEDLLKWIGEKSPILLVLDDVRLEYSDNLIDKFRVDIPNYKILVTSRTATARFDSQQVLEPLGGEDARKLFYHMSSLNQMSSDIPDDVEIEEKVGEGQEYRRRAPVIDESVELRGMCTAPPPPVFTVGLDVPLNELKLKLLTDSKDISLHMVTGSPGVGKTTLVKALCWDEQVRGKFNENIFFFIFGTSPQLNWSSIAQQVFQHISCQVPKFQSDGEAVQKLRDLLEGIGKKSPILLVLDDVWLGSDNLINNFFLHIPNYKILMTSRSGTARLGSLQVLKPLGEEDAKKLFYHIAFLNQMSSDISNEVVEEIVRACRGYPSALNVTGTSLRGKPPLIWQKRAQDFAKGYSIPDLVPIDRYKDLGLFPKDQRIRAAVLVDLWAELHSEDDDTAMKEISQLVEGKLANIIETRKVANDIVDYNYHYVTQHGGLREVGISQNSHEPEQKRTRLIIEVNGNNLPAWWNIEEYQIAARILSISTDEIFSSKWCNLRPTEVEALVLNIRQKKYTLPWFMGKMKKLKVLTITNYVSYHTELEDLELLDCAPNLKRLWLEKVSISFLSKTGIRLNNLQKCTFFMCNVNTTFKCFTAPVSGMLQNLVEMNFDYCTMVELPVVLCNCVLLTKLRITYCQQLSALPERIDNLVNLELLSLSSCADLLKLTDSITSLVRLKFLDISDCIRLNNLPEDIGKLINLQKLNVRGCSRLTELPASTKDLANLKDVVCDKQMEDKFEQIRSDLQLHVAQDDFNLDFVKTLRSS